MTIKKRALIFLVLTFAVSWSSVCIAWLSGQRDFADAGIYIFIFGISPALAAIACSFAFEKGHRLEALGIKFRLNWWWLWAMLLPLVFVGAGIGINTLFSPYRLLSLEGTARHLADLQHQSYSNASLYLAAFFLPRVAGFILLAIGEELGWRGYLYSLWRPLGFWRASFAIGFVWGIWHSPLVYLYGLNYPDHRLLGLLLNPLSSILFAPILTLVRDRGYSVWPAVLLHGMTNGLAALIFFTSADPRFGDTAASISITIATALGALLIAIVQWKCSESRHCKKSERE